jgi:hypothetical protein
MPDLELHKISFTKGQLKHLDEKEVVFIVQMANLLQDLSVLQKIIYISSKGVENDVERMAENGQAMFFYRILAGILFEGWNIISSKTYRSVMTIYYTLLNGIAKNSLEEINNYFKVKNNLIERLRNNFSFHYNFGYVRDCIRNLPDSETLDMFIAEEHANCRYTASDTIVNLAILKSINESNIESAMRIFFDEVSKITKIFLDFAGECILVFAKRCPKLPVESVVIKNAPMLNELRLNYFITRPNNK